MFVVCCLGLVAGLGIRSFVLQDSRFGWGMFMHQVNYNVTYTWMYEDGREDRYVPGSELRGRTWYKLRPGQWHSTWYATGAMRSWLSGYASYMFQNHSPPGATAFRADVIYRHNKAGQRYIETILFPYPGG